MNQKEHAKFIEEAITANQEHIKLMTAIENNLDNLNYVGLVNLVKRHGLYAYSPELQELLESNNLPPVMVFKEMVRLIALNQISSATGLIERLNARLEALEL